MLVLYFTIACNGKMVEMADTSLGKSSVCICIIKKRRHCSSCTVDMTLSHVVTVF